MADKELDLTNWMKYLDGTARVVDSYIPGSHDASAYEYSTVADWINWGWGTITQSSNYYGQLRAGIRYFDMRVALVDGVLRMKHGSFLGQDVYLFERLDTVLREIKKFTDFHKNEFIFLDFDFPYGENRNLTLEADLVKMLKDELGEQNFATAHVDRSEEGKPGKSYTYNKELTWDQLRADKKPFIIIWQSQIESNIPWAPNGDKIKVLLDGHFDEKQPSEIVAFLDESLRAWKRERLFITDLVNTPYASPFNRPEAADLAAQPVFQPWLLGKEPGENLGIVRRDFVNNDYARGSNKHIILMNKFSSEPDKPSVGASINYLTDVRLYAPDGRHVFVDVKYAPEVCLVTAALADKIPNRDDVFLVQSYYPNDATPLCYSGNINADGTKAHGGFRLVHHDTRTGPNNVGDKIVLGVGSENGLSSQLYWGVLQKNADNLETFFFFDPDNMDNTGPVHDGDTVLIRSLNDHNWWKIVADETKKAVGVYATATSTNDATLFTIKVNK